MSPGDIVCILGGFDERVRKHASETLVFGTLDSFLVDGQVMVLLEGGDIYVGPSNMVRPKSEQE